MCVCVCVCCVVSCCVASVGEKVLARRIRHRDYTIWTTHQGIESRVTTFRFETHNVSSVAKSLCNKTVSLSKSSHSA